MRINKTAVLWVDWNSDPGMDVTPVWDGVVLPVRSKGLQLAGGGGGHLDTQAAVGAGGSWHPPWLTHQPWPFLRKDALPQQSTLLGHPGSITALASMWGCPVRRDETATQMMQSAAAPALQGPSILGHSPPILEAPHCLPVCFQAQWTVLLLTYEALCGQGPGYLNNRLRCVR